MKKIYFNRYPDVYKNFTLDQSSIFDCVKDFDAAMQDCNLIRVQENDQLDVNNIPNIDLSLYYTLSAAGIRYTHKPLIYTFNDELNSEHPLYLYFYLCYANICPQGPTAVVNAKVNMFIPLMQLEIRDANNNIRSNKKIISIMHYSDNSFNYNTDYFESIHIKNKSAISNIDNKILHVNVCSGLHYKYYNNTRSPSIYGSTLTYYNYNPFMNFILRRYDNGDYLLITTSTFFRYEGITQPGSAYTFDRATSYPLTVYNQVSDIVMNNTTFYNDSYVVMSDYYNLKKAYAFPLEYYVPGTDDTLKRDEYLLVCNAKMFPEVLNAEIEIKLDENITKVYHPLSTNFTNLTFNSTSEITLLVAIE